MHSVDIFRHGDLWGGVQHPQNQVTRQATGLSIPLRDLPPPPTQGMWRGSPSRPWRERCCDHRIWPRGLPAGDGGGLGGAPRAEEGHVHSPVAPGNNTVPFLAFYIGTSYLWSQHNHSVLSEKKQPAKKHCDLNFCENYTHLFLQKTGRKRINLVRTVITGRHSLIKYFPFHLAVFSNFFYRGYDYLCH